ncbi:2-C-methyl-D-erythritol 4-phosphate cytidylyltransferase [uncultured Ramlibacter sp.]|uniref:2-C-methyl-D-erythritol 4-phosphate cytidylyltransferase n=1 Tax=uncultured Ramlibacter sp. TaxID=260755 RepID=UPI0026018DC6|nr:2-C-methyl-D-erythritol 4-phosphate cytidylyltransferase [uncultured Ramlibacter sp.]
MNASPPQSRFFALIPSAGHGSRAGGDGPKQYRAVAGKPMVEHTLAAFAGVARLAATLVVVAPGDTTMPPGASYSIAECGGSTRAATVLNGLQALRAQGAGEADWVLVHDAARCLITAALVDKLIDACAGDAVGGLLAHPLADTLKMEEGGRVTATLPREAKWLAQTPQMFRLGLLVQALQAAGDQVTDEAGAVEALGHKPLLVPGGAQNFKVTYPDDFALADAVLRSRQ